MAEGRRIIYDGEDRKIYDNLLNSSTPFKRMNIIDLFAMAIVYGKEVGIRKKLGNEAVGRVRESTINSSDIRYLMMAIAADEEKSIDVLAQEDDYFSICEEYAKAGINLLNSEILDKKNEEFLDDTEEKLLEFYDKYIE